MNAGRLCCAHAPWYARAVASPRGGGGGASGETCPPNFRSDTPWDRCRSEEIFKLEKMRFGLQYLLPRFTCTDVTATLHVSLRFNSRCQSVNHVWISVKLRDPLIYFSPGKGSPKQGGGNYVCTLNLAGQTSPGVQGNPYQKLKTPRIWATIFGRDPSSRTKKWATLTDQSWGAAPPKLPSCWMLGQVAPTAPPPRLPRPCS